MRPTIHPRWIPIHRSVPSRICHPLVISSQTSISQPQSLTSPSTSLNPHNLPLIQTRTLKGRKISRSKYPDGSFANKQAVSDIREDPTILKINLDPTLALLKGLGAKDPLRLLQDIARDILSKMNSKWIPRETAEQYISPSPEQAARLVKLYPTDHALVRNGHQMSEALHQIAKFLREPPNRPKWGRVAVFMLRISVELANLNAALLLWIIEAGKSSPDIPGTARTVVKDAAISRSHTIAMMVYIDYIHTYPNTEKDSTKLEYLLAKDLWNMIQPGPQAAPIQPNTIRPLHPWKLLYRAADKYLSEYPSAPDAGEARQLHTAALLGGVKDYSDIEACSILANDPSMKIYSDTWVEMKTKLAMTGHADACLDIGKYHLEKHGWYPTRASSSVSTQKTTTTKLDPLGQIGLDYIELSASLSTFNAKQMASRFLVLALILRENGRPSSGLEMLEIGIEEIKSSAEDQNDALLWLAKLESFRNSWDGEFSARAAHSLGPPRMEIH